MTYGEHLANILMADGGIVINKAIGSSMAPFRMNEIDGLINVFPDVTIINIGIVDACTRSMPLWLYRFVNNENPSSTWIIASLKLLINYFEKRFRRFLVIVSGKRSWVSSTAFKSNYSKLIHYLKKETNTQVICLSINQPDLRVENSLPGSTANVIKFNDIVKQVCQQSGSTFLDVSKIVTKDQIPDGIHFNSEGHQKVADAILSLLKS